jgi:hypothetical protein
MSRHLAIVERVVHQEDAQDYLSSLVPRQQTAANVDANFWVFAHASDANRFVEFVEGSDASQVARLSGVEQAALWRAIEVK